MRKYFTSVVFSPKPITHSQLHLLLLLLSHFSRVQPWATP